MTVSDRLFALTTALACWPKNNNKSNQIYSSIVHTDSDFIQTKILKYISNIKDLVQVREMYNKFIISNYLVTDAPKYKEEKHIADARST